jgi:hypothetical protein
MHSDDFMADLCRRQKYVRRSSCKVSDGELKQKHIFFTTTTGKLPVFILLLLSVFFNFINFN